MPNPRLIGSPIVGSELGTKFVTRYHFAGTQNTYFSLPAFKNKVHCTRFTGFAALRNPVKEQKSISAFGVAPTAVRARARVCSGCLLLPLTTECARVL